MYRILCSFYVNLCCCDTSVVYYEVKKRQLRDRGLRRSSLIFASCVGYFDLPYYCRGFMFYVTSSRMLSPYWGEQNMTAVELSECTNMWLRICMGPYFLLVGRNNINSSMWRGDKWSCITRWIGQTITRNRTQNMNGEWSTILFLFPLPREGRGGCG